MQNKTAILAVILVSYLMIILDVSIVITGLPHIRDELAFTTSELSWIQSIYTLFFGGFLLLGARGGDIVGRRAMFQIGLAVFTIASVAIAFAQSAGFMINLPIGIVMALAARRNIPETERHGGRFDTLGAVLSTIGFGLLILGIVRAGEIGMRAAPLWIGGLVVIALFAAHERRAAQPIMPLRLFAHRVRLGAYLARFLFLGGMVTFFFFSTQIMQEVLGFTALQAGLGFLPMTLMNFVVAMQAKRAGFGARGQLVLGLLLTFAGMVWLAQAGMGVSYATGIALPMVLIGAGQGFCFGPMTAIGISGVAPRDSGAASGLINVAHQIGSSFGLGLTTAVAVMAEQGRHDAAAVARGASAALMTGSVLLALAVVAAVALILPVTERREAMR